MAHLLRNLVGAIDQGTSSTRFVVYDEEGHIVASSQKELRNHHPREGWTEQDPMQIIEDVHSCVEDACSQLTDKGFETTDVKAIGITNQRETAVAWDKVTGRPLHNTIVWSDNRTADLVEKLEKELSASTLTEMTRKTGLRLSTYFTALKLQWLMNQVSHVKDEAIGGRCLFGTIDSWLLWNLTGGAKGGVHVTDVTNASRTMLMNLATRKWDAQLLDIFGIPPETLPMIRSSSEIYGHMSSGTLKGVPISSCLGDQQAALVGQLCLNKGDVKNTYGTGCFLLTNVGTHPVLSHQGLLSTVAFQLGPDAPCYYALEGSIAGAGTAVQWLRDQLGIIKTSSEVETLSQSVDSTHGVYFVPAFSGLFAPHWRHDARGTIVGLSQYSNKAHIARATLEAVCFQTREVLEAMTKDCGVVPKSLQVDGGMTKNNTLLQIQADILGITVSRPENVETTSWGAAMTAGTAKGIEIFSWKKLHKISQKADTFMPETSVDGCIACRFCH